MSTIRDPSAIRLYACAGCINRHIYLNNTARFYSGIHVIPWNCAQCGKRQTNLSQPCFSFVPDEQTVKWYMRDPAFYHKIWFIDSNYGYFETQFSNIVEIET